MKPEDNYININRDAWNNRVEVHLNSDFYNQKAFLSGKSSLNRIELDLLGKVEGKSILHLQCHFGQDSISLNRLGAEVTGVDLSNEAIDKARSIAETMNVNTEFICCDIYDLPNHCDKQFDIVFTSYGTIGWLPNLDKWAKVIDKFLKPNGEFILVEFHPVVWMFDDKFESVDYRYFNTGALIETESGTYADKNSDIIHDYVMWNHSLSEVFQSLLKHNLTIVAFNEFDYSPYNCFENTIEFEPDKFRIRHLEDKIPMVYSLLAKKLSN